MKVKDVIEALSKLDQELYVCGFGDEEISGLFSGVTKTYISDKWHDALPEGEKYIYLEFDKVIPHMRGEGACSKQVPPPVIELVQECQYCGYTITKEGHTHCKVCSWMPMLKVVAQIVDGVPKPIEPLREIKNEEVHSSD